MNDKLLDNSMLSALADTTANPEVKTALGNYIKQRQVVLDLIVADLKKGPNPSLADVFSSNTSLENHVNEKLSILGKNISAAEVKNSIAPLTQ